MTESQSIAVDVLRPAPEGRAAALLGFLYGLRSAAGHLLATRPERTVPADAERHRSLLLAEAVVRRAAAAPGPAEPPHIAVIGPTQTGKSSVVNALLGTEQAHVSPLAGFTVHPQAFIRGVPDIPVAADHWLPGLCRRRATELVREDLLAYSVELVPPAAAGDSAHPSSSPAVLWDTPDFDSIGSPHYQLGLLEVLALADVHVLVVSKEKYADLSVWKVLRLLAPLRRPLVICVNKLTPDVEQVVPSALRARLRELSTWESAPLLALPHISVGDHSLHVELRRACGPLMEAITRESSTGAGTKRSPADAAGVLRFLRANWQAWVQPLAREHAARHDWTMTVRNELEQFLQVYRREFLDDPKRFDSFRRATIELLQLLEIPGVSRALTQVRNTVTWPLRRLVGLGREWWQSRFRGPDKGRAGQELLLASAIDDLLVQLRLGVGRRAAEPDAGEAVWASLRQRLTDREPQLRQAFDRALREYSETSARLIHDTADELYRTLQQHPTALQTLRAARATTDLAGLALAIKTGGVHINDLLLAPAMFAITTLMTEGVLGRYMSQTAARLKELLFQHLRDDVVTGVFQPALLELSQRLGGPGLIGITPDELRDAELALESWEQSS